MGRGRQFSQADLAIQEMSINNKPVRSFQYFGVVRVVKGFINEFVNVQHKGVAHNQEEEDRMLCNYCKKYQPLEVQTLDKNGKIKKSNTECKGSCNGN